MILVHELKRTYWVQLMRFEGMCANVDIWEVFVLMSEIRGVCK